ncbi:hypothetical protein MRY82_09920 [bacterium]|nr:hypothetical protein [bacterium]
MAKPICEHVIGLSALKEKLVASEIDSLLDLDYHYGGFTSGVANHFEGETYRYVYSKRWGWLDLRHISMFAFAQYHGMYYSLVSSLNILPNIPPDMTVLKFGELLEIKQCNEYASGDINVGPFSYEDLTSNLLGSFLGNYQLSRAWKNSAQDFQSRLIYFFYLLGAVDNPIEVAPNGQQICCNTLKSSESCESYSEDTYSEWDLSYLPSAWSIQESLGTILDNKILEHLKIKSPYREVPIPKSCSSSLIH